MKKARRWRSLGMIGLVLIGFAAASFFWLQTPHNAGEPISPKMVLPGYGAGDVLSLEFFPDGKTLLSAYEDGSVRLWDVDSGQLLQTKSFPYIPRGGALVSNDGRTIAVNDGYTELRLWNVSTGKINILRWVGMELLSIHVPPDSRTIHFSPDSRTIAAVVGNEDPMRRSSRTEYSICIWDVETGALLHKLGALNQRWEGFIWYSPDSKKIVIVNGNAAKVWDVKTGALLHTLHGIENGYAIAFSPDRSLTAGVFAAVCAGPSIKVWDLETGALLHTLHGEALSFKYSPDGKRIASVSSNAVKVWDTKTGALLHTSEVADMANTYIVDYFPDGKSILINPNPFGGGLSGSRLEVWDVETGALIQTLGGGDFSRIFSLDGKKLIHVDYQRSFTWVEVWDAEEWKLLQTSKRSPDERIHNFAYSQGRKTLARSFDNGEIQIWDFEEAASD